MERVADHYLTTLSNVPSAPKWSFGGRPRPVSASATPGPGTYESGGRTSIPTAPSYGFGSEVRGRSRAQPFPGPGAYDPSKQSARTAPQWSMTGRRASTKVDSSPGPGAYDVKHNSGSPSYGLGTGQRKTFSAPNTPGPGAYSPRFLGDSSPQWGMGTQNRSRAGGGLKVDVPGPGTYTLPSRLQESPQYSMAGRGEQKRKDNSPGPGAYNPHYPERDAGKFSFGVKPAASKPGGSTPGPGAYNMTGDIASPKSPQWSFGSQVRGKNYATSSPGPGQYNPENSPRKRPPAWSLGGSGERGFYSKRDGPAPGTYNIPSRLGEGAKYSLGTEKRDSLRAKQDTPGPCAYDPRAPEVSPKWGFGTSQRSPLSEIRKTPGPGTYNPIEKSHGPQWTFNPRRSDNVAGSGFKKRDNGAKLGTIYTGFGY